MEVKPGINYPDVLANVNNFADIEQALTQKLFQLRDEGAVKIGFVSGRLRKEHMGEDSRLMSAYARALEDKYNMPVVCSAGIFFNDLWVKLPEPKLPEEEKKKKFQELFQDILVKGPITHVYMLPHWREAPGSVDERIVADLKGLHVYEPVSLYDI